MEHLRSSVVHPKGPGAPHCLRCVAMEAERSEDCALRFVLLTFSDGLLLSHRDVAPPMTDIRWPICFLESIFGGRTCSI